MRYTIVIVTVSVLLITLFILLFVYLFRSSDGGPIITTSVGDIQGLKSEVYDYYMYLGIPYARVDVSDPFGKSLPHPVFDSTYQAVDDSVVCPQLLHNGTILGDSLDCLRLNVFVPNSVDSDEKIPVMVWIHGGAFNMESGWRNMFEPRYLVRHDVIVVTLNYRLGPYGFMCLDIPEVPGNQGLRDQVMAFEWIYNNIEAFGGDLSKITLFGEGAGAISIDLHLRTEQERFFNNVILMSGTSLAGKLVTRDSNPRAPMQIAQYLGYTTDNVYEALSYLLNVEPSTVLEASHAIGTQFGPCAEKYFENNNNFMTDYPVNVNPSKIENMPIMVGYNSYEQVVDFANAPAEDFVNRNVFSENIQILFDFEDEKLDEMERIVREFYIAAEPITELVTHNIIYFDSDVHYTYPTDRSIQSFLDNNVGDVYYYVFSYVGSRNIMRLRTNTTFGGAAHSDILGYMFDAYDLPSPTEEDQVVLDRLTTMWTNFAKYSNPTPETSNLLPITWTPLSRESPRYYMNLDLNVTMAKEPFNRRTTFWELFYEINQAYERPYGFMCLDIPEVPGNQGLRDQVMAFEWIYNNIEAFGGDLSKITLFGEGAGAISIDS